MAGVAHGDIRPQNMLVNGTDVFFIDFHKSDTRFPQSRAREKLILQDLVRGREWQHWDGV